ncbi:MAG: hypothetical protein AABN34_04660 [Acidobacteriota bacterium]
MLDGSDDRPDYAANVPALFFAGDLFDEAQIELATFCLSSLIALAALSTISKHIAAR